MHLMAPAAARCTSSSGQHHCRFEAAVEYAGNPQLDHRSGTD
jgi:hypothetical protein